MTNRKRITGRRRWCCVIVALCVAGAPVWSAPAVLTLRESITLAQTQSETLQQTTLNAELARAHRYQALGQALPQITAQGSESIQDLSGVPTSATTGDSLIRRSRPEVSVTLQQPLFQGFREFHALRIAGVERDKARWDIARAREVLIADVARAYYTVVAREREAALVDAMRRTVAQRVREVDERIDLGKSRESERAANRAELAGLDADLAELRGAVQVARSELAFFLGRPVTETVRDPFRLPSPLPTLAFYLDPAAERADVKAASAAQRLAEGEVRYEQAARWPTAGVQANYYPYRIGFYKDVTWDVLLNVSVPISRGGTTRGNILEARTKSRQQALAAQASARRAEADVRSAYAAMQADRHRAAALAQQVRHSAQHYAAQQGEYALGLTTYMNVLQALRDWYAAQRLHSLAQSQQLLSYVQLLVASGTVSTQGLASPPP